jgi:crotonobetainyl-CoA:carnitine CoA-transferase CaiB-like acyl-CoA transferase
MSIRQEWVVNHREQPDARPGIHRAVTHFTKVEELSSLPPTIDNGHMQILGPTQSGANRPAFALGVDTGSIVTRLTTVQEARALPPGSIVGDLHGGLTFTDAVAAALEGRSAGGWQELQVASGEIWTIIILNR